MISTDIIDQGTIDTTLPATSDPLYQVAALALFYRQQFAALKTAGFNFARPQVSDFSTFNTGLNDYLSDAYDRETEIIQSGASSIVANIPDILAIGAALTSGGAPAAAACVLNIILGKLLGGDSGAHGHYEGKDVDMSEVIAKLEEIRAMLQNSTGQNVAQVMEDAFIGENAASERYALIWNLINQAIRIIVDNSNTYDDVIIEESTP